MKTVVEYPEFIEKAEKIFSVEEREAIVAFFIVKSESGKKVRALWRN
jgi:hypothetical protein